MRKTAGALHLLAAKKDYQNLLYWFSQAMAVETPDEDFLGMLRGELKRVDLPNDEIAATLHHLPQQFSDKGPAQFRRSIRSVAQ